MTRSTLKIPLLRYLYTYEWTQKNKNNLSKLFCTVGVAKKFQRLIGPKIYALCFILENNELQIPHFSHLSFTVHVTALFPLHICSHHCDAFCSWQLTELVLG